jgi:acyl-CoA dehydrogenase
MNVIHVGKSDTRTAAPFAPRIIASSQKPFDFAARAAQVAAIAARHADEVDRDACFPVEAITAAREARLLGVAIPREFGGEGASVHQVMEICYALGRACSATAMIFAMHQVKIACIVRHGRGQDWMDAMMCRIADEQLLMGSSTTEGNNGGNVRSSAAAAEISDGRFTLLRDASVISYGAECDGIVTTARRAIDAATSDQVLVVLCKEDYKLEITQGWDVLGMRGTRSTGFKLKASGVPEQILPESYDRIHSQTMVPFAHLCWGSAWAGIAASAVDRAQFFLSEVASTARALLTGTADYFERIAADPQALSSLEFQSAIATLKIDVSELAVDAVMSAMRANGLSGYRNDGEFSITRQLRDILSAPVMIHNDRIFANVSTANLMAANAPHLRA